MPGPCQIPSKRCASAGRQAASAWPGEATEFPGCTGKRLETCLLEQAPQPSTQGAQTTASGNAVSTRETAMLDQTDETQADMLWPLREFARMAAPAWRDAP
ncbi:hypothetical protein THIX_20673 [Thiomonas sp. X19]|nr:hypothetical protein THIX_20673 [Thiomonas sp. X19]